MPRKLAEYLPFVDEATRAELFGSLYVVGAQPRGTPIREGVILGTSACLPCLLSRPLNLTSVIFVFSSLRRSDEMALHRCDHLRHPSTHHFPLHAQLVPR